jgi:hypothetical protein
VDISADGVLTSTSALDLNGEPIRFAARGNGIWQGIDTPSRKLYFVKDASGRWEMSGTRVPVIEQKTAWYQSSSWLMLVLGMGVLVPALGLLGWPLAALTRRHYGVVADARPALRRARWQARAASMLLLLPWAIFGVGLMQGADDITKITGAGFGDVLRATQMAAWLALVGAAATLWVALTGWRLRQVWWGRRLHYSALAIAGFALCWSSWKMQMLFWNGSF